jgi:prophage regulatory protein
MSAVSTTPPIGERFLRLPEVMRAVSLGRSRIYELEAEGRFPHRVRLGDRAAAWVESEIASWIAQRIAERDAKLEGAA